MAYRKRTIRSMLPVTRRIARLIGELESAEKRLKNLIPDLQRIEFDSQALRRGQPEPQSKESIEF